MQNTSTTPAVFRGERPNILLIMSDQHSPRLLGCAGDSIVRTPSLDRLAEQGVRFENHHCANPLCVPSRMTFLTSRHSSDIGVWTNQCRLESTIPTFVHYLGNADYETVLCGRMHFTGPDQRHGFERRILGDVHAKLEHIPMFTTGQSADGVKIAGPGRTAYTRYDQEVTHVCRQFLETRDKSPGDRPFFMTVGFVLPHCPFIAPKQLFEEYLEQVDLPQLPADYHQSLHPFMKIWRAIRKVDELADEEVRIARAAYYGLVTLMDQLIGQILDTLVQTRFGENTLVIYTSDHGEMAGEHRMWWKSSFYQSSVGVPLIFSWPGRLAEGLTIHQVTSLLDVGPTLVEMADGSPMQNVSGQSLCRLLNGYDHINDWPDTAFAELGGLTGNDPGRMIRRGLWKLNYYHGYDRPQLFNLEEDPHEWHDLGGDSDYSEIRHELLAEVLKDWSGEAVLRRTETATHDRQILEMFHQKTQHSRRSPADDLPDRWTAPDGCNIFPEI